MSWIKHWRDASRERNHPRLGQEVYALCGWHGWERDHLSRFANTTEGVRCERCLRSLAKLAPPRKGIGASLPGALKEEKAE